MDQTPATRFVDVLGRLGYKTQQQIADLLEIARPTAGTIVRYEKPPSFESIARLKEIHPEINMEWIFTGVGTAFATGNTAPASQLPPAVPSKHEAAEPSQPYWRVMADSDELKQVKDERDYLREQNRRLLDLLANNYGAPATVGKSEASADAANLYALTDRIFVDGLVRYPQAEETEEVREGAHYSIDGERLAA